MAEACDGEHAASRAPPPLGHAGSKMTNQQHSMLGNLGMDESLLMKVFDFTRNQMYKRDLLRRKPVSKFFSGSAGARDFVKLDHGEPPKNMRTHFFSHVGYLRAQ